MNNGVTIEIPAGALTSDVTITVDEIGHAEPPSGATSVGPTIQLGPEGQTFAEPVKVTLPWSGGSLPVVIAHSPRGGGDWTRLSQGAGSDATHVWANTSSFSWFQPVYYQGSPDAPIVFENDRPVWPQAVALEAAPDVHLYGSGFRTDTVVTLFKDGVTTMTVSPVTLTSYGLRITLSAAFTDTLGLITVQAKNPQAAVGDAAAIYVIATPNLHSLSPTEVEVPRDDFGQCLEEPVTFTVSATDLPDDFSWCGAWITAIGGVAGQAQVAILTHGLSRLQDGFSFVVDDFCFVKGPHDVYLSCGGVSSNKLFLDINPDD